MNFFKRKIDVPNLDGKIIGHRYVDCDITKKRKIRNLAVAFVMLLIVLISPFLSASFMIFGKYWLWVQIVITLACEVILWMTWWDHDEG